MGAAGQSSGFMPYRWAKCWPLAGWLASWIAPSRSIQLLISTTTRTGQELARERFGAERVFYCPLDLPWAVRAYLNALQPRMLVLAETEFWPNLLSGCFRRGIPVAVVNARISDRSWPRYRLLRRLWRPFLSRLGRVLAQSETDAERLMAIGCRPERVSVAGNLKFDVRAAKEAEATRLLKALAPICGLSWRAARWKAKRRRCWKRGRGCWRPIRNSSMVLAPRHPERFAAVAALLDQSGISWSQAFELGCRIRRLHCKPLRPGEIVLLDTIGELASVYSLAAWRSWAAA